MSRRSALALPLAAAAIGATSLPGGVIAGAEPLGIRLEGSRYSAPVAFLPLVMGSQPVRMAYMDILAGSAANGRTIVLLHGKNFDSSYWAGRSVGCVLPQRWQ